MKKSSSTPPAEPKETRTTDTTRLKEGPMLIIKGFLMGGADVIPGVSGGTMALILGIYSRLIHAIKSFDSKAVKSVLRFRFGDFLKEFHWRFLVFLISGIISAFVFFTRVVPLPKLMYRYPEPVYGLFFGLILGSVYLLIRQIKGLNWVHILFIVIGVYIGYRVVTLVPTDTPESLPFIFVSGAIAICAMILPGISGSFLLLILHKYTFILTQFGKLGGPNTMEAGGILLVFIAGMVVGITSFSRVLSWFLDRYYSQTISVLIGFLIGSLYVIWPFQIRDYIHTQRVKVVSLNSREVQDLQSTAPDTTQVEYERLGKVVQPSTANEPGKIQVITVKKKLISSKPFWPEWSNPAQDNRLDHGAKSIWQALISMAGGLILVIVIEWLASRKGSKG